MHLIIPFFIYFGSIGMCLTDAHPSWAPTPSSHPSSRTGLSTLTPDSNATDVLKAHIDDYLEMTITEWGGHGDDGEMRSAFDMEKTLMQQITAAIEDGRHSEIIDIFSRSAEDFRVRRLALLVLRSGHSSWETTAPSPEVAMAYSVAALDFFEQDDFDEDDLSNIMLQKHLGVLQSHTRFECAFFVKSVLSSLLPANILQKEASNAAIPHVTRPWLRSRLAETLEADPEFNGRFPLATKWVEMLDDEQTTAMDFLRLAEEQAVKNQ